MKKVKKALDKLALQIFCKKEMLLSKLADTNGSGFLEEGSKAIIIIVVAVFALGAILLMFRTNVIPSVIEKIKSLFDADTTA